MPGLLRGSDPSRPPNVAQSTFSAWGLAILTAISGQYLVRPFVVVEEITKVPSPSKIPAAYAIGLSSGGSEQARHVFEDNERGAEDSNRLGNVIPEPPFVFGAFSATS